MKKLYIFEEAKNTSVGAEVFWLGDSRKKTKAPVGAEVNFINSGDNSTLTKNNMTKLKNSCNKGKKKIVNKTECLHDLRNELPIIFEAFNIASEETNDICSRFTSDEMCRGFEPSLFSTAFNHSIHECSNGTYTCVKAKYGRRLIPFGNYLFNVKKLNNKGVPTNVKTVNSVNISKQLTIPLFNSNPTTRCDLENDVLLFFGYKTSAVGMRYEPQIVCIDNAKVQWTIKESDIEQEQHLFRNELNREHVTTRIRAKLELKKKSS